MKRKIGIWLSLVLVIAVALQCMDVYVSKASATKATVAEKKNENKKEQKKGEKEESNDKKIKVVCMIFPQYDWVKNVIGTKSDRYDVTLLLDNGSELHSYQPTVADVAQISSCDFFFYVGGESDSWVEDVVATAKNPNLKAISLLDMLENYAKVEEEIEGASGHSHEHEEETEEETSNHIHEDEGDEGTSSHSQEEAMKETVKESEHEGNEVSSHAEEYDEHMWLSLKNAQAAVKQLAAIFSELDGSNKTVYEKNAKQYEKQLSQLDTQYKQMVDNAKRKTILFGDRFPFRYLADDYGLTYYAAFEGCSAETGVGFDTIVFLSEKMDEEQLPVIFTLENANTQLAQVIVENTKEKNAKILTLHSMQSVTKKQMQQKGFSYLSLMEDNFKVLKEALN